MATLKKFIRAKLAPGVYGILFKNKHIEIKDREIFITGDEKLIKVFEKDPEIEEFKPEIDDKTPKQYSDRTEQELLDMAKERGLEKDDVTTSDTTIEGLITELQEDDVNTSKPENDQGEQAPE